MAIIMSFAFAFALAIAIVLTTAPAAAVAIAKLEYFERAIPSQHLRYRSPTLLSQLVVAHIKLLQPADTASITTSTLAFVIAAIIAAIRDQT